MIHALRAALGFGVMGVLMGACVAGERPSADRLSCRDGACVCSAGFGNCDGEPNNGCEAVLDVDPSNCGQCGTMCVNGTCEVGECACNGGFFDCNGDAEDGCEALVRVAPNHCGECGHSCLGGECRASRCAPFLFAELGSFVYTLTANDSDVFYCDGDSGVIYRVSKAAGGATELAADQNCYEMAASESHVFWSVRENGDELIRRVPVEGGPWKTIAVTDGIDGFAATGERAVWSEYDSVGLNYELFTTASLGPRSSIFQSTFSMRNIIASGDQLFWVEEADTSNNIVSSAITGGGAIAIATRSNSVGELVVVGGGLYWLEKDSEGNEPKILRVSLSGGDVEELYQRSRVVDHLLADTSGLYWTEDQGDRWLHAPLDGGDVTVLAEYQDITLPVLGPNSLYWLDYPSHLFALAK